ncbi:hypothetical protein [Christiangramia sp. SM2212]|uniref:Uncharacterized protein n=1 Tax=Christiangramia sediminicola TaxID=3073267 RepID=A0ABU1ER76_9FLAO|nr:hypothetical protein [Christiangramia sp. SM2212]MDR5590871.1 hypothetical protein [Christiangramia sp. SM2212]
MRSEINLKWIISFMLVCFISGAVAQNASSESVDKLFKVYQDEGIEAAIVAYNKSNPNKEYEGLQEPLNQLGYRLLNQEKDVDAAQKVFLAQIDEYPEQPNPYDSYADAMMKKGDKEEAKKHLKKAISMMDNWKDKEASKNLMIASKSKLARLEDKHKGLNFLAGNWEVKSYGVKDGEKTLRFTDDVSFEPSKFNSVIITRFFNEEDQFEGTQLITYDAIDDEYDIVRVDNNQLNGFHTSTFKIKENTSNKTVVIETSEENGEMKKSKHVFTKSNGELKWEIHEMGDENKENMVAVNEMKKKN